MSEIQTMDRALDELQELLPKVTLAIPAKTKLLVSLRPASGF